MKRLIFIFGILFVLNLAVEAQTAVYKNNRERVLIGFGKSNTFQASNVDFTITNLGSGKYRVIYTDPLGDVIYIFTYTNMQVEGWYYYKWESSLAKIELATQNKLSEIANGKGGRIAWVHTSAFDQRSVLYDLYK